VTGAAHRAGNFVDPADDPRTTEDGDGSERSILLDYLGFQRRTLELKCSGLDAGQLALRSVEPSTMSLLGLVRHLADVERGWFRRTFAGQDAPPIFQSDADPDGDFNGAVGDDAVVAEAWSAWRAEVAFAEQAVADVPDLQITGEHHRHGPVSLREILVHLIEEYARHNGHADLLRERIDGRIGE
jgi:uncharacterized damage-inducible protein DinB